MSGRLPEPLEIAIARVACGRSIVCHLCNASDVTDDDHRSGCPVHELRRVIWTYLPEIEWESREGMVTVYLADGTFAGCMGVERWERLLVEDFAMPAIPSAWDLNASRFGYEGLDV